MAKQTLTKTKYISYLSCPEELWMSIHERHLMPSFSDEAQFRVGQGQLIDKYVQGWFKSGAVVNEESIDPELVDFQLEVKKDGFIAVADVTVTIDGKSIDIYEVKATTKVANSHIHDVAFQKAVFEKDDYKIKNCYLVHLNSSYTLNGELELNEMFVVVDISEKVNEILEKTRITSEEALKFINSELDKSKFEIGCQKKLNCSYLKNYHHNFPEYSIFDINRISNAKLQVLNHLGIKDIKDVPDNFPLSPKQRTQVGIAQGGKEKIDVEKIKEQLNSLKYPLYFLDYETFQYAVPQQNGIRPYQQMVFQYSLHVIPQVGGKLEHHEFLLNSKTESVENLILHMKERIDSTWGTIIVWNQGFEKGRNKEMARDYPEHSDFLLSLNERTYDLMTPFNKGYYQHPKFKGSASIKNVLPILCPELNYGVLEIQNGNSAVAKWHLATSDKVTLEEKETIFKNLLAYCHLDTLAMVEIWEKLKVKTNVA